jgi:hypothetical protein
MPARYNSFSPLDEVTSDFLNDQQDAVYTQRGSGSANTLAVGLDTPTPQIRQKEIAVAMTSGATNPPVSGQIDASIDWRDRQITFSIEWDPTWDIRWGEADDDKQPFESTVSTKYTRTGGALLPISLNCALYVDTTNGYLWLKKPAGFIRGVIRCTAQLKERS